MKYSNIFSKTSKTVTADADSVNAKTKSLKQEKLGIISSNLFFYLQPSMQEIFKKTNQNYKDLLNKARELRLNCPIVECKNEYIVSPRFSILVDKKNIGLILKKGRESDIEVGRWFSQSPPNAYLSSSRVYSYSNSKHISESIINFPCHWTLTKNDLKEIELFMLFISKLT